MNKVKYWLLAGLLAVPVFIAFYGVLIVLAVLGANLIILGFVSALANTCVCPRRK
jgi:hypothetical protein